MHNQLQRSCSTTPAAVYSTSQLDATFQDGWNGFSTSWEILPDDCDCYCNFCNWWYGAGSCIGSMAESRVYHAVLWQVFQHASPGHNSGHTTSKEAETRNFAGICG